MTGNEKGVLVVDSTKAHQDQSEDIIEIYEAHVSYTQKALEARTTKERDQALLEGLLHFGLTFLNALEYFIQLARERGSSRLGSIQDLKEETISLLLKWLNGERMTERSDEDERRIEIAKVILK